MLSPFFAGDPVCPGPPVVVEKAGSAETGEALVKVLATAEPTAGESPLSGSDLLDKREAEMTGFDYYQVEGRTTI